MSNLALNALFHGLLQSVSVGLPVLILVAEGFWLTSDQPVYLAHARYWSKLLGICVAAGILSGIPLALELGVHGMRISQGNCFLHEITPCVGAASASLIEFGSTGIMLLGWNRLSRRAHLVATAIAAISSTLAAFWTIAAQMTARLPTKVDDIGIWQSITHHVAAILHPGMERSIPYLWMGAIVTSVVVVGGVSAWKILRREQPAFFARSFKVAASLLLVVAAVHILVTKSSGMTIWASEPLRVANGVSAWLLVLAVWTASSWRRTFKRVVNSASDGRLLLA